VPGDGPTRRRRPVTRLGLTALPLVALIAAGGYALAPHHTRTLAPQGPVPAAATPTASRPPAAAPPAIAPAKPADPLVATSTAAGVTVYAAPGGTVTHRFAARTELGSPQTFLVVERQGDWLRVRLPVRPNTATGWVPAASVTLAVDPWQINVDRAARTLTVLRSGTVVRSVPVAVGAPATPTPVGTFYITDFVRLRNPYGAYGPYAYGLSGHSDVITSFNGGDGVIGIHGTNADWSVGRAVSHGCIRLRNADVAVLATEIPLGTPVEVT
jgi:lipoprotein-anchoring transpeptidase ErfK/SrfK